MKKQTKFLTTFSNIKIRPVVSEEKDKYLSLASTKQLKKFIPNIDTEANIDLLPVAFDACVVNRVNKNGDVIDNETAANVSKYFVNKPINVEHNRNHVVGCILTSNFSKFGSNEVLTEEEVKNIKGPFNVTLGGVIWKIVSKDLADKLEESNDPTSENYMSISASWELGFDQYNIVMLEDGEKNIENAEFITDEEEISDIESNLRSFGGSGKFKDKQIYRQVLGKVIPLGVGLTLNPAADVKGVAVEDKSTLEKDLKASSQENNISQDDKLNVKKDTIYMKISKIEEITDALLKEVTASSITDFIAEEIKKVNDQFVNEKAEKENEIKVANEKLASVATEHETVKKQLEELNQKLASIEAEQLAKAKQEAFNIRMAAFDEEYDLSDEDRKVLAEDIKDLNDEAFAGYKNKMAVLMKEKNKSAKKAKASEEVKASLEQVKTSPVEEVKPSQEVAQISTTQEVVEQAVDNGSKASAEIPNSAPAAEPTIREKYAKAFDLDGFEIKQ
jgi:hypothetical protein